MNTKKNYIILSLAVLALGFGLVGITFAWYSYSNAESSVSGKTVSQRPSVIFAETEYIESTTIMPIKDEDRDSYGAKNSFIVTIPKVLNVYEATISINLIDINISSELKTENYKYVLLENDMEVASGNFSNVVDNKLEIMPMKLLSTDNLPYSYNYQFIVWLSDDGSVQNDLMDKEFKAKLNVISAIKKR